MKVILKKRVANLGHEWDIVNVKNGYARNFLLPRDLAIPATEGQLKRAEKFKEERMKALEEVVANAKAVADKLGSGAEVTFTKKARGEKLYGSIKEQDIAEAIAKAHKIEVSKEMIHMKDHIKALGEHKVKVELAEGVAVNIIVKVEAEA
jgi:large subunit ribosomal protein L9